MRNVSQKVTALNEIYKEIEKKIDAFKEETQINCVFGCGECCNHFEPYISVLEGLVVAQYLRNNQEKLRIFYEIFQNKGKQLCPFYNLSNPNHCEIYEIRPMICRLFAFSAKTTNQETQYCPCKMIQNHYAEKVSRACLLVKNGFPIPIYKESYQRMQLIDFVLATDLHPLTRSIEIALKNYNRIDISETTEEYHYLSRNFTFSKFVREHFRISASSSP